MLCDEAVLMGSTTSKAKTVMNLAKIMFLVFLKGGYAPPETSASLPVSGYRFTGLTSR